MRRRRRWLILAVLLLAAAAAGLARWRYSKTPGYRAEQLVGQLADRLTGKKHFQLPFIGHNRKPEFASKAALEYAVVEMGPKAVPALTGVLRDKDVRVRERAAVILWQIGPLAREAVPALVEGLKDPDDGVRLMCAIALCEIDPPTAVVEAAPIMAADVASEELHDFDRAFAADVLLELDPDLARSAAMPFLRESLALRAGEDFAPGTDAYYRRLRTAGLIIRLDAEVARTDVVPVLVEMLGQRMYMAKPIELLAGIGPTAKAAAPALSAMAADKESPYRVAAAEALAKIDPGTARTQVAPLLIAGLQDGSALDRIEAAEALAKIDPRAAREKAVPVVLRIMENEKPDYGGDAAAEALCRIDPETARAKAVPILVRRIKKAQSYDWDSAGRALLAIDPELARKELLPVLSEAMTEQNGAMACRAMELMGEFGPAAAEYLPQLRKILNEADDLFAEPAAAAIRRIEAKPSE